MTNYFSLCYIIQNILYTNCYQIVDITLPYSLRPRRHDLTLKVVDHISFLTAISFLDNYLRTETTFHTYFTVFKLRSESFLIT